MASVTEISAVSERGFEDAITTGINRATQTLRNVEGAWVKDMNALYPSRSNSGSMSLSSLLVCVRSPRLLPVRAGSAPTDR